MPDHEENSASASAPGIRMPDACCGCLGEAQASLRLTGLFYESAGIMKYREIRHTVEVPVCMACAAKEKRIQVARWIIAAACGIPFIILGFIFKDAITGAMDMPADAPMDAITYHIATFIWGFLLGLVPAHLYVSKSRAVSVNRSGNVRFKNEEYRMRFQELNK